MDICDRLPQTRRGAAFFVLGFCFGAWLIVAAICYVLAVLAGVL